ncbi:MAG: aldehyde-activating protein, partial [Hyphomicrobiales bacterium]
MSSRHLGSCLCGDVRFEIAGDFEKFYLCHCSRCRKDTGSAHGANLFASAARL